MGSFHPMDLIRLLRGQGMPWPSAAPVCISKGAGLCAAMMIYPNYTCQLDLKHAHFFFSNEAGKEKEGKKKRAKKEKRSEGGGERREEEKTECDRNG